MAEPDDQIILRAALKLPPKERAAYLDRVCAGDAALRQRISEAVHAALAATIPAPEPTTTTGPIATMPQPALAAVPGEQPGQFIGRYKLLEKIGEGGMGSVWVAEQKDPVHRKVALKVIKLGMDTRQVIARFEAERQALALMDHPNIAKVLDAAATETGRPFFVMELVSGIRITDYCDRHNLTTRERLELLIQVCKAIQHAHQKGILHRDIKPPNILVALHDGLPTPKVIDFGIAKAIAGQRLTDKTIYTAFEEFIGTPAYMSPEQAEMNPLGIDARSDVYSLGVLLYELLTGLTPFAGERFGELGPTEIRRIIREEDPPRPSTRISTLAAAEQTALAKRRASEPPKLLSLIRGDLDWIVMKCLEKDRTHRYAAAVDLALDLQRYLNHDPIMARPPSRLGRARKLVRRHKLAFAAGLAILLLTPLAGFLLAGMWPSLGQRGPPNVEQLLRLAETRLQHYDKEGFLTQTIGDLKTAAKVDPTDTRVWGKLGWANWLAYEDNDQDASRREAWICSSNSLRLNPDNPEGHLVQGLVARDQRDWPAATNHLTAAKELTRSANGIVLASLALASQAAGDPTNANLFARLALEAAQDQWDVFNRLGLFRQKADARSGLLEGARTNFEAAVRLAPDDPLPHRHLGQILLLQAEGEEAKKELETSLRLRRSPQTLAAIGSAYLAEKDPGRAARFFSEASRADPSRYNYHVSAGLALRGNPNTRPEASQHFAQALRQTEDALSSGGENARVRAYRGLCLAAEARAEEARKDLETAQREAADDYQVLGIVRDGYLVLGDKARSSELNKLMRQGRN